MTDLLERVALGMCVQAWMEKGYSREQVEGFWEDGGILNKSHWRKRAQAAIDAYEEWQPMWEAPRDGTPILLVNGVAPNLEVVEGYWRKAELPKWGEGWVSCMDPDVPTPYMEPPCWRPLPAPPKGDSDDAG